MVLKIIDGDLSASIDASDYLTAEETQELEALRKDPSISGVHVMTRQGAIIESSGIWERMAPAICSNMMRLATRIGEELGESSRHIVTFTENDTFEVAVLPLTNADVAVIRRHQSSGGLSNVY